eukprot:1304157-Lingulodinium_polyedra.AAC.1
MNCASRWCIGLPGKASQESRFGIELGLLRSSIHWAARRDESTVESWVKPGLAQQKKALGSSCMAV